MQYRPLGATGLSVSALGYGASPLGGVFGPVDEAEGTRCVRATLDQGVNYLDVSPYYGETRAETALGRALRGVGRDRYVLSTKVGRYGANVFDFSAARVSGSVDESLTRLGVDFVDILFCHDIEFGRLDQIASETLPALRKIVAAGKARFVGVSALPLAVFPRVIEQTGIDVVLSYCHHTLSDTSLDILLPYLAEKGVGAINASPLAMGLFGSGALPTWHPAPPALRQAAARAAQHCELGGARLSDLAVSFSLSRPDIASTLVGSASEAEMRRNIAAALRAPDPALLADVREILRPALNLSWPSGLPENDPLHQPL